MNYLACRSNGRFLVRKVPEHLDEVVGESVQIDLELAFCFGNEIESVTKHRRFLSISRPIAKLPFRCRWPPKTFVAERSQGNGDKGQDMGWEWGKLTLNVISRPAVFALVVVHHLDHLQ